MVTYIDPTPTPSTSSNTAQGPKPCACAAKKAAAAAAQDHCRRMYRVGKLQELTALIFLAVAIVALFRIINKSN